MPLVRDLAAEGIPVVVTCEVLGFSPQAFYKWRANPVCDREWDDAHLTNAIVDIHADDPEFGYRFIADELEAAGHQAGETRVHRLCREHKVWSTTTKKGRKSSGKRPGPAVHDDLVQRVFTAPRRRPTGEPHQHGSRRRPSTPPPTRVSAHPATRGWTLTPRRANHRRRAG